MWYFYKNYEGIFENIQQGNTETQNLGRQTRKYGNVWLWGGGGRGSPGSGTGVSVKQRAFIHNAKLRT